MLLSEFKNHLQSISELSFMLPNGLPVPSHFHLTEIGQLDKRFIDCGGTVRYEQTVSMQLWTSVDVWHRLDPNKTIRNIELAVQKLAIGDLPIEVGFQGESIQKFGLRFSDGIFHLESKQTACLASDACGIPGVETIKEKVNACCTPGGGCC